MSITNEWADPEKTIALMSRGDGWTWAEFDARAAELWMMIRSVAHRVDVIVMGSGTLPPGQPVEHFKLAIDTRPANMGIMVIIEQKAFGKAILSVMLRLNRITHGIIYAANSVEDARALIEKMKERAVVA